MAIVAAMVAIEIILANTGVNWIAIAVLIVLAGALVLFPSLTVAIRRRAISTIWAWVIRKRFKLNEIESCRAVKNPWYYGWGIRQTPQGMLFRVSGLNAVQIKLITGKEYLIGTDVPQELEEAIRQAISYV